MYSCLMSVLDSFNKGHVIITMTREEYEKMEALSKHLEESSED